MAETTGTPTPKTRSKTAKPAARKTPAATAATISPAARKTQEKQTTVTPAKSVRKKTTARTLSAEDRQRLIADAAYVRAEQPNFVGGDPVTDWLEAETDVNASLSGPTH